MGVKGDPGGFTLEALIMVWRPFSRFGGIEERVFTNSELLKKWELKGNPQEALPAEATKPQR